jgi:hypothetical protein
MTRAVAFFSSPILNGIEAELLYGSRVAQIFGAICLAAAGETIEFWITAYLGNFIINPVTSQHTEMAMVIGAAAAFCVGCHGSSPVMKMSDS